MKIDSQQFGPLEFSPEAVVRFPAGLLGFETLTEFLLIDQDEVAPLRWFQPIAEPGLVFTVIDPLLFFPDYVIKLTSEDREYLGLEKGEAPLLLTLVTIPEDPSMMTANLLGPLVMNPARHVGRQLVLHDSGYPVRKRLISDEAKPVGTMPVTV